MKKNKYPQHQNIHEIFMKPLSNKIQANLIQFPILFFFEEEQNTTIKDGKKRKELTQETVCTSSIKLCQCIN